MHRYPCDPGEDSVSESRRPRREWPPPGAVKPPSSFRPNGLTSFPVAYSEEGTPINKGHHKDAQAKRRRLPVIKGRIQPNLGESLKSGDGGCTKD